MMANELILKEMNRIDLYDLQEEQVLELQQKIVSNVNIKKMKEAVTNACMNLSQVGRPSYGADLKYIALDNQARLELIYNLLHNFDLFEKDISNFKRNKNSCNENYEYIFNFLTNTKDMVETIVDFGEFKKQEYEDNMKQLEENKRLYLKEGEE